MLDKQYQIIKTIYQYYIRVPWPSIKVSIKASSELQEQKNDSLDTFRHNSEEFMHDAVCVDTAVAEVVNNRKDDFYSQYNYLKPACTMNFGEKAMDWAKKHWKVIATIGIVIVAVALICTGVGGIVGAMADGVLFGAATGGILGGTMSVMGGSSFWEGFENGAFSGAIAGIISGGMSFGLAAGGKVALSLGKTLLTGGITGTGTSLVSDLGDIFFKGANISVGQIISNMLVSGTLGILFAGVGYGISKSLSTLFKNVSWFSNAKELFRVGKTSNSNYGKITSYTTKSPQGASINFANRLGKCIIRVEFDADKLLHYHIPALFGSKAQIPLLPILNSILSDCTVSCIWNQEHSKIERF